MVSHTTRNTNQTTSDKHDNQQKQYPLETQDANHCSTITLHNAPDGPRHARRATRST